MPVYRFKGISTQGKLVQNEFEADTKKIAQEKVDRFAKPRNIQVKSMEQRDFAGNITDAFFSTGTILRVTPNIITQQDTSFILLNIMAERSTANPDPVSTIINKQEAVTQVLLYSGESTVIAGLYETDELTIRRGIPFLKDLPPWFFGLRYIFGYNSYEVNQTELIIVIKAEIIPSLRERFNQTRGTSLEVLDQGRMQLLENNLHKD